VDLTLAVNYLPVCACVLKCLALSLALCVVHLSDASAPYVPLLAVLILDRLLAPSRIFDASSILLSIWGAAVVSEVQSRAPSLCPHPEVLRWALSCTWVALALHQLSTRARRSRVPLALAAAHIALAAFIPVPAESTPVRLVRYLVFPLLAIGWLYFVGIYRHRLAPPTSDSAIHFAVHFAPVLYVHPYAAAVHAVAVLLIGSLLLSRDEPDRPPAPARLAEPDDLEADELERVFRQAKSSLQAPQTI
jgi:hypothetical protein